MDLNGVPIPSQSHPTKLFRQLFVNGSEADVGKEIKEPERGRSIRTLFLLKLANWTANRSS